MSKVFRDRSETIEVLKNISFDVRVGEVLAVVGPSGCGKTTLLRILGGLIRPNHGQVRLDGEPVVQPSSKIAYMFQEDSLLPWKTAVRNVSFALESQGCSGSEATQKAREYLELVELGGFEDFYPHQLSGGMKQRVALARALVTQPEILLMDEPLATLDPQLREVLQEEIARIRVQLECTVVLVSHDVDEIVFLADRALLLSKRPATVRDRLEMPFPRSRAATLRAEPSFANVRAEIWQRLRKERIAEPPNDTGGNKCV